MMNNFKMKSKKLPESSRLYLVLRFFFIMDFLLSGFRIINVICSNKRSYMEDIGGTNRKP